MLPMKILNVDEIRSGLQGLANQYPSIAQLVRLPEATYEKQESFALVIGKRPLCPAGGVMITGGMHAREWGGPDICVYLAADILAAYAAGVGLTYKSQPSDPGKTFDARTVRNMVERMTIVIFPCVNPDGVRFSHANRGALWRKNRRPHPTGNIGVDNCRNFDFLWDYETAFDPAAIWDGMGSKSPSSNQFHGTAPFSEPETRNVRWLIDQYPQVRYYLDLHSYSGFVLHPWGDDENQFFSPSQNFRNINWNKKRGILGRPYGEYTCLFEQWRFKTVTNAIRDAIKAVRGTVYTVYQLFLMQFQRPTYPTSGVSFDWVYSRHLTDRSKRKVWGYGMEFSQLGRFPIEYEELKVMAPEVTAGLVRLCQHATPGYFAHLILCRLLGIFR